MNKKHYEKPAMCTLGLHLQSLLICGSQHTVSRPSANYMSNPSIGDEEDDE